MAVPPFSFNRDTLNESKERLDSKKKNKKQDYQAHQ